MPARRAHDERANKRQAIEVRRVSKDEPAPRSSPRSERAILARGAVRAAEPVSKAVNMHKSKGSVRNRGKGKTAQYTEYVYKAPCTKRAVSG